MPAIGDAWVDVRADTTGFEKDVERGVTKSTKGATKEMGGLEKQVQGVGLAAKVWLGQQAFKAVGAIKDAVVDTIRAASDLQESQNAVRVSFGESADAVAELGKSAAVNLGLSNAEFNQLSVSVSAFTEKISQGLGQDVPTVVDNLTTRIADFASVMNLDVADGFEKFRSGLAGESEPLRKFGIDVSAATVEQVALAEGIIRTGEAMSESDKVTARYLAIMQQTQKMAGDFANTSDDFANSQRILNAEIEDAKAVIGTQLLPVMAQLFRVIRDNLPTIINLTTNFFALLGIIERSTVAVNRLSRELGEEAAASAAGLLTSFDVAVKDGIIPLIRRSAEAEEAVEGLRDHMGRMAAEELMAAKDGLAAIAEQENWTAEETRILGEAIDKELSMRMAEGADQILRNMNPALAAAAGLTDDLAGEMDILGGEVKTATDLLKEQQDMVRANIDPMFRLREATSKEAEAQAAVNLAVQKFGEGSVEHLDAIADLSDASLDLKEAQDNVRVNTDLTREAFIRQQVQLGLTRAEAELLADEFAQLNAFKFDPKTINILTRHTTGGGPQRQHGGPVSAGRPYIVGEAGEELFVPNVSGQIISNRDMRNYGGVTIAEGAVSIVVQGAASVHEARRAGEAAAEGVLDRLSRAKVAR